MRRLHSQIYLAFLGVLLVCSVLAGLSARSVWHDDDELPPFVRPAAQLLVEGLPEGDAFAPALIERADKLALDVTLWSARGERLVQTGVAHDPPDRSRDARWFGTDSRVGLELRLDDGRYLSLSVPHAHPPAGRLVSFSLVLGVLLLGMALLTYPVARRMTRRLQALKEGVERLGEGDLDSRVVVRGRDEIAELAGAFNAAADRIDALVQQQRRVLASASHELRAPLSRLRMALSLLLEEPDELPPGRRAQLLRRCEDDIEELDALVGDVLTAARLERAGALTRFETVDLAELVAQEAARVEAMVAAPEYCQGTGDARLLRRMLRNLLDNAVRHGGGAVKVVLECSQAGARLSVADGGAGVPEAERERIFEPFYRPAGHSEGRDGGIGLGLALVRQIAEHHGGSARCLPRDGGGSHFVVELPEFRCAG